MESALVPQGAGPSTPQQPTPPPNKKASPPVLAVTYPLNNSGSKTITVGLDVKTLEPILRIKSSSQRCQLVDLEAEEAIQLFHLLEDVGDVFEELKRGPRELSSQAAVCAREFVDTNIIRISKGTNFVCLANQSIEALCDMIPLIKHHLSWLREDARLAAQWLNSLMTKISHRRHLYEPQAQPWTTVELDDMYATAKWRSFGDRFKIIREMEETTETTRTQLQFLYEVSLVASDILLEKMSRGIY